MQIESERFLKIEKAFENAVASDVSVGRKIFYVDIELLVRRVSRHGIGDDDVFRERDDSSREFYPVSDSDEGFIVLNRISGENDITFAVNGEDSVFFARDNFSE
jgi:hypothetical protein